MALGIPPNKLYSYTLIRSVYLSDNTGLIDIFKRYLPIPGVDVFKGDNIPAVVAEKQAVIEQSIQLWRERTPQLNLNEMTNHVVKIQRQLRSKLRYQEEIRRIAARDAWKHLIQQTSPKRVIRDANRPYRPRCADQQLAKRVMVLAQQVRCSLPLNT